MTITELSIKRPSLIVVVFLALALTGLFGYFQLRYELLPKMSIPYASIVTAYPGASPGEVENGITKKNSEFRSRLISSRAFRQAPGRNRRVRISSNTDFSGTRFGRKSRCESLPMTCDAGGPGFNDVFPALPNPRITIEPSIKPYYHALCVLSGNFTTLVWQKTFREFEVRLGIPPDFALLYLRSIVRNLNQFPGDALTGPIIRKETKS